MILQNGPVAELAGRSWCGLELSSERSVEPVLHRTLSSVHNIFGDSPVEIFVPICKRDLDEFELTTGVYIFVRGDRKLILRLRKLVGVIRKPYL